MKVCEVCSAAFFGDYAYCPRDGAPLVAEGEDRLIGKQVDRFHITERIADGRLGRVYHGRLGERRYAIKILAGDLSADLRLVKRFRQSAHLLSKARHENVAEVLEFDTTREGLAFVATRFVPGRTLATLIAEEAPVPRARAEAIVRDLAAGLAAAHAQGLVYRDLRPANVRITQRGASLRATICDFALVGLGARASVLRESSMRYAAPECLEEYVGPASDLYSLGVILADLVEGGDDEGHHLLPLLLHRLPEGRLRSAKDVLAELDPSAPKPTRSSVATDDLELVVEARDEPIEIDVDEDEVEIEDDPELDASPLPASLDEEWASHIVEPPPREAPARTPPAADPTDAGEIVEVVVGTPDQSVPWPETQRALAERCVELGVLSAAQRDRVLEEVAARHERFLQVIARMHPNAVDRVTKALATNLELEVWAPGGASIHPRVLATIPQALATELGVVPYALRAERDGNTLFVAVSDPVEKPTRQAIEAMVNHPVIWTIGAPEDVDAALEQAYGKEVKKGVPATMRIRRPKTVDGV